MALKVLGAGFGRTGTLSLKYALEELGFGPCHHMMEVMRDRKQTEWFYRISQGDRVEWGEVFDDYSSAVDWPSAAYYAELMEVFPNAKVILSVRDPDSWYKSVNDTIFNVVPNIPQWVQALFPRSKKIAILIEAIVWQGVFKGQFKDKDYAIDVYEKNTEAVMASVPSDRLLIHSAKEGWEPICKFLEVPLPETQYPWVNDRKSQKRRIIILRALKWLPLFSLALSALFILELVR